jgi:transposase
LKGLSIRCVALESTGGYEVALAEALRQAGLPVAVLNPKRVRDFAKAMGTLAKTDRIDAVVLARFAQQMEPKPSRSPDQVQRERLELVTRRTQLIKSRTAEINRLEHARSSKVRRSIQTVIKLLDQQIKDLDRDIEQSVRQDPNASGAADHLRQTKGIGNVTARTLVAGLPELGRTGRGPLTALVGLAPYNRDSGTIRGRRAIRGGRFLVRSALYMATLSAIRFNPVIKPYYQSLKTRGLPSKSAMVACMRKLLHHLNSRLHHFYNQPELT